MRKLRFVPIPEKIKALEEVKGGKDYRVVATALKVPPRYIRAWAKQLKIDLTPKPAPKTAPNNLIKVTAWLDPNMIDVESFLRAYLEGKRNEKTC
jgi:hypothetical protein